MHEIHMISKSYHNLNYNDHKEGHHQIEHVIYNQFLEIVTLLFFTNRVCFLSNSWEILTLTKT